MLRPLLSPSQRAQLFDIADDITEQELVHLYTLSAEDIAQIQLQREDHNRLGFAVQMAYLRFPGRPMQSGETVPYPLLTYLAAQLHLSLRIFPQYAKRDTTRREHAARIQKYLHLQSLSAKDEQELQKILLPKAIQTGSNIAVITGLLDEMRSRNIILPAISTVEKIAYFIQEETRQLLFTELTANITNTQKEHLDRLLTLRDNTKTQLVWLKNYPRRPTPQSLLSAIERIEYIDALKLPARSSNLYENRISRLAREGMRHTPQYIERLDEIRRYGLLVAIITELRKDIIDQTITMHDKMIGQFFSRSERQQKEAFHKRGKAINEKVRL